MRAPAAGGRTREDVELTESELERWGRRMGAAAARAGVLVALHGPLGAGKTRLVQAACRGAGVVEGALSPTFTLVHRYEGERGAVWHVDLYRIEAPSELADLGWDELLDSPAPAFVEWAERAGEQLPEDRWEVRLQMGSRPETRRVRVAARGSAPPPPAPRGSGEGEGA